MQEIKNKLNTFLYSAQSLAKMAEIEPFPPVSHLDKAALLGACLCLKQAWETWLVELASYLNVDVSVLEDEQSPIAANLPDCQLLFSLKQKEGSWYQQLRLLCSEPLFFWDRKPEAVTSAATENVINIVALDADNDDQIINALKVIEEFKAYIALTREQQTQW